MLNKRLRILAAGAVIAGLSGCATVSEYQEFAKAGAEYSVTLPPLYSLACKLHLDASSWGLVMDHYDASGATTPESLEAMNVADLKTCVIMKDLSEHAALLSIYFSKLNALSTSDAGTKIGAEVDVAFGQVLAIGKQLRGSSYFSGTPQLGAIATIATNYWISDVLKAELEKRKDSLMLEFYTQEILLKKLAEKITSDQKSTANRMTQIYVDDPISGVGRLYPEKFVMSRNKKILGQTKNITEMDVARKTSKKARIIFEQLVSGDVKKEIMIARIKSLVTDIKGLRTAMASFSVE